MAIKVGINGFGRIGRVVFRTCLENSHIEVKISAINDPAVDAEYICYLMKFDSTHGKYSGCVTHSQDEIQIEGYRIKLFHHKQPASIPWDTVGVQFVVEASGMFTNFEKASGHLANTSVKRVIVTAPSVDVPMIILGVNDDKLRADMRVISSASSTLWCLAPIVKVLEDNYGVSEGFVTSIHAMTPSLKPLDGLCVKGKQWRDHRSIHQNIIPATTGACRALGKIIPQTKDKLTGLAFRVPIVNVSVLDLTVRLNKETTLDHIVNMVKKEELTRMQNIITTSREQAVSSDFAGDSHSCTLDVLSSLQLKPNSYKLVCWYENEYSYACRVLESVIFSDKQFKKTEVICNMAYVKPIIWKRNVALQTECCQRETSTDYHYCPLNRKKDSSPEVINTLKSSNLTEAYWPINKNFSRSAHHFETKPPFSNTCDKKVSDSPSCPFKLKSNKYPEDFILKPVPMSSFITEHCKRSLDHQPSTTKTKSEKTLDNMELQTKQSPQRFQKTASKAKIPHTQPLSSNGNIKTYEIFKIWKDDNSISKTTARKNTEELFQNCLHSSEKEQSNALCDPQPVEKNDFIKAQDRLEKVKEEFSKMVDITEDLLKHSFSNKLQYESWAVSSITEVSELNVTKDTDIDTNKLENIYIKPLNSKDFLQSEGGDSVDYHTCEIKANGSFTKKNTSFKAFVKESESIIRNYHCKIAKSFEGNVLDKNSCRSELVDKNISSTKRLNPIYNNPYNQEQIVNVIDTFINSAPHTMASQYFNVKIDSSGIKIGNTDKIYDKRAVCELQENKVDNKDRSTTPDESEWSQEIITSRQNIPTKLVNCFDETAQDLHPNLNAKVKTENTFKIKNKVVNILEVDESINSRYLSNHIANGFSDISPTRTSKSFSPTNTTMTSVDKIDQDIYDKLDSASVSDSENSFQVNERASQILNITDLSNSMEDLMRLDKICRIIEISDDLSDELFSTLNRPDCSAVNRKNWSFKDLCERIKLDEFCNKVFGKSAF